MTCVPTETQKAKKTCEKESVEELKHDDNQSTVKVTKVEKMATPTVFYVPVEVHNSSPLENSQNQLYMENVQFVRNILDEDMIATEGDNRSVNDTRCKIFAKPTKVNFSDKVQVKYYDKDSWDYSETMETVL